jgi:glycine dehydrogenase subunit 1
MATYVPNTKEQQQAMLDEINKSFDDLIAPIPSSVRLNRPLNLPKGLSEFEALDIMKGYANQNVVFSTILRGAGAYIHYIPSVVKHLSAREEFVTAYTPYQSELSQGILQSIFEYQTIMADLTGMDAANASVYDGATAVAEAISMCIERKQRKILLADTLHPETIETVKAYNQYLDHSITIVPSKDGRIDLEALNDVLDDETACFVYQHPNYFGILEDAPAIGELLNTSKAKLIAAVNPISLAILKDPKSNGVDIAVGEAQPFGLAVAFGGPYLGFMATSDKLVRKLPGRIVGQTVDLEGNRAFALTLQAREQHIRREKALSSICSNQAHCALIAGMYASALGPQGLYDVASSCYNNAHYFQEQLQTIGFNLLHQQPFFHEFVTTTPILAKQVEKHLMKSNILSGYPIDDHKMLWCTTEVVNKSRIDEVIMLLKEVQS